MARAPGWLAGSLCAALALLVAVWAIAALTGADGPVAIDRPPLVAGDGGDVFRILGHNALVLALHAMACVAGFIAGSSLPLQAEHHTGLAGASMSAGAGSRCCSSSRRRRSH